MPSVSSFDTPHDGILDMECDYHGKRLATCSGTDICIYEVSKGDGASIAKIAGVTDTTSLLAKLRTDHEIVNLSWCDPSFGSMLATGGGDGSIVLWRETKPKEWISFWREKIENSSINCLQFCPKEFGPILTVGSSNGLITLYCRDESMGLVAATTSNNTNSTGKPNDSSSQTNYFRRQIQQLKAHQNGVLSLSWAPPSAPAALASGPAVSSYLTPSQGPRRFVSGGKDGNAKIWRWHVDDKRWVLEMVLNGKMVYGTPLGVDNESDSQGKNVKTPNESEPNQSHSDWVNDVAWRPNIGIPTSTIATGGYDGYVNIWTQPMEGQPVELSARINMNMGRESDRPVFKLKWSISGGILAVSSGDGTGARIDWFKETLDGCWVKVSEEGEKFYED